MTKSELSKLYHLNHEIEVYQQLIEKHRVKATAATQMPSGMPHASGISDKVGDCVAEIGDLETLIELKKKECIVTRDRILRYIFSIDDSLMRQILILRHISGLTWQQIAFSIGENDESYPRRKYNAFIKLAENAEKNVI